MSTKKGNSQDYHTLSWWNRIKFKLLLFGVFMSIAPILLIGLYNIHSAKMSLEESVNRRQQYVVQRAASEVDYLLSSIKGRMELLANANKIRNFNQNDIIDWEQSLYGFLKQNTEIENAYVFDKDGKIVVSAQRWIVEAPANITNIQYQHLKNKSNNPNQCSVGEIGFKQDGSPYVNMGIPFFSSDGRTFYGGMIVEVSLRGTFKKVSAISSGKEGYIYIVDNQERLIAHTDFSQVLLNKYCIASPELANMLKNRSSSTQPQQYESYKGEMVIGSYAPIQSANWSVVVEQPITKAYAPINILVQRLIITMSIAIGLVVLISIVFGIWFAKPIELMGKAVEKVSLGHFDTKIDYQSDDEFGTLAQAFNHMTSELKMKSEHLLQEKERLDTIVNGSGAGFALVNEDYHMVWMNQKLEEWLEREQNGHLCYSVLGKFNKPCIDCPITLNNFEQCQTEVTTSLDKDGRKKIYSHRMYPLEHAREGEPQFLIVVEDITEQRQLEEMVEQADKLSALGILASGFAHEVNNPLASISAYAEDLKERLKDEPNEELIQSGDIEYYLDIIHNNVDRCKVITNNLLNFSRKNSLEYHDANIPKIVEDSIVLLQHAFKKKKILINKQIEDIPLLQADGLQIQQVFVNLLQNAIDAVENGGTIDIYSKLNEREVELHIKDNGAGMTGEKINKAFDPFFTTKPVGKGTGLGLYISYNIIRKIGGNIIIESKEGIGTDVTVMLPRT